MLGLFKAELKRYRLLSLIALGIISLLLAFYNGEYPLLENQRNLGFYSMFTSVFCGLVFGVVQMAIARRKNHWAYLVHKPLSCLHIHRAMTGAGALMLMYSVVLPLFAVFIGYDVWTNEVVEWRHYMLVLHTAMFALASYFLGCYIALSANRGAILTFGLIALMAGSQPVSLTLTLVTDVLVTLILFYLSLRAFKVNLTSHFNSKKDIVLGALVLQPAVAFVVVTLQLVHYHVPLMLLNDHPRSYSVDELVARNDMSALHNMDETQQIEHIFGPDDSPIKQQLMQQASLTKSENIYIRKVPTGHRGMLATNDRFNAMEDEHNKVRWIFSHNKMVWVGKHKTTGDLVGYLGMSGFVDINATLSDNDRFKVVPRFELENVVIARNKAYIVDFQSKQLTLKYQLPEDDTFSSHIHFNPKLNLVLVKTDKAIYLFDMDEFIAPDTTVEANNIVPHPRDILQNRRLSYSAQLDGYLIEYYHDSYFGFNRPGIGLVYAKHDGSSQLLIEKAFDGYGAKPALIDFQQVWVSPIINGTLFSYLLGQYYPTYTNDYVTADNFADRIYPKSVYVMSVVMAIFSALMTWWLARRLKFTPASTKLWVVMNLIFGLSGLLTFFLMNRWRGLVIPAK